jgi:hypothetical protein
MSLVDQAHGLDLVHFEEREITLPDFSMPPESQGADPFDGDSLQLGDGQYQIVGEVIPFEVSIMVQRVEHVEPAVQAFVQRIVAWGESFTERRKLSETVSDAAGLNPESGRTGGTYCLVLSTMMGAATTKREISIETAMQILCNVPSKPLVPAGIDSKTPKPRPGCPFRPSIRLGRMRLRKMSPAVRSNRSALAKAMEKTSMLEDIDTAYSRFLTSNRKGLESMEPAMKSRRSTKSM